MQHQLARIYIIVGEPEKALDQLEPLLRIPYYLSPGWLKIDPNFAPLRSNPRFQKLVAGARDRGSSKRLARRGRALPPRSGAKPRFPDQDEPWDLHSGQLGTECDTRHRVRAL